MFEILWAHVASDRALTWYCSEDSSENILDGSNLWKGFLLSTSINCLLSIYVTVTESHSSRVMRFVQAMIDLRGEAESLLNLGQKDLLEELLVGHGLEVVNH